MPLISVVIPVYKTEKYLDECIKSVISQTLQDIEIILVDDGSPDNCPQICDDFEKKDRRIKVIHKKNGGVNSAIILGIRKSTADIVGFVDSDDWVQPDFFKVLYENMIKFDADCINSQWTWYDEKNTNYIGNTENTIYNKQEIEEKMLVPFYEKGTMLYSNWSNPRWNKLYKKEILKEILPLMNEKLSIGEDIIQNLLYLSKCGKVITLTDYAGYMHRTNPNSITQLFKDSLIDANILYIEEVKNIATSQNRDFKFYNEFHDGLLSGLIWLSLSSDNLISEKANSCKLIKAHMLYPQAFLKSNFIEFNKLIRLGFCLIQHGFNYCGVVYITAMIKIISLKKKVFNG